jgi:glycosyltransferase involved in cell wall biosynthesis
MLGYGAAWGCFIPRLWGTRVWVNMDGLEWARSKWRPWVRVYLRLMERVMAFTVDRVLADAQAIKQYYEGRYPSGAPCTFIPYGAEGVPVPDASGQLARHGLAAEKYFLVVARMEPENHIHEIIRAYQQWGGAYPLVVVGDHTADNAYCRWIRLQQSPSVVLLGALYDAEELAALRTGALAYVHGHSVGGTNPSLLEAMWYGSVVLAHDNPFNREVLADEGLAFASEDALTGLYQRVCEMTPADKSRRRQHTRQIALSRYQWPLVVTDYLTLLQRELGSVSEKASSS